MYILVLSTNRELKHTLIPYIDGILVKNHLHNLNLYSQETFSLERLRQLSGQSLNCYILLDATTYSDVPDTLKKACEMLPHSLFCILAETDQIAPALLNTVYSIYGYINLWNGCYLDSLAFLLTELNHKYRSLRRGLCICEDDICRIIPYEEIYYIETLKNTHRCVAHCRSGCHIFRSNIKTLIYELDERFLIVKSSVIANISAIKYLDCSKRILYFEQESFCSYARIYQRDIRCRL